MNSLYTKAMIALAAVAIIVALAFGVLWQNNNTIDNAAERASVSMAETVARLRAEDALAYENRIRDLESRVNENNAAARLRVSELDQRQRRTTADLIRRIDQMPDNEVGDPIATVLEQSRERWPE